MTIEELEHYRGLKAESKALKEQIEDLYNTYHSPSFESTSFSNDSKSPVEKAVERIQALKEKYNVKLEEEIEQMHLIEEWLETIDDKLVSASIRYHYILGKTWRETTEEVYGDYWDAQNAKYTVRRYLQQKQQNKVL